MINPAADRALPPMGGAAMAPAIPDMMINRPMMMAGEPTQKHVGYVCVCPKCKEVIKDPTLERRCIVCGATFEDQGDIKYFLDKGPLCADCLQKITDLVEAFFAAAPPAAAAPAVEKV